mmetsp:Transcript_8968/g.26937  ORF Transcript_8968/g.26937 Transcript_8968/m.26937 type:complete len:525 (-) Transcript_8968:515-2089(-)
MRMDSSAFASNFIRGLCVPSSRSETCLRRSNLDDDGRARRRRPLRAYATAERLERLERPGDAELRRRRAPSIGVLDRVNVFRTTAYDKEIISMATPTYASMLMDPLSSFVDTLFVARLGVLPLAGVGVANSLFAYFSWMFFFLSATTTTEVAAAATVEDSSDRRRHVSKTIAGALWVALLIGIVSLCVAWTGAPFLVSIFGASADVSPFALIYLRIRALALPAQISFFVLSGAMRGLQDLRSPFYASVVCNLANVFLDAALMWGCGLGVAGAAAATSIAQTASVLVLFFSLVRRKSLHIKDLLSAPSSEIRKAILAPGAIMVMEEMCESATLTLASSMAARIGAVEAAAMALSRQLWNVLGVCWWPLSIVMQSMVAGFYAKKDLTAMRSVADRIVQMAICISTVIGTMVFLAARVLPGLLSTDKAVQTTTAFILPVVAMSLPIDAVCDVLDRALTGCKEYTYVAKAMLVATLVSIPTMIFFVYGAKVGVAGAWLALSCMSAVRLALILHRYRSLTAHVGDKVAC